MKKLLTILLLSVVLLGSTAIAWAKPELSGNSGTSSYNPNASIGISPATMHEIKAKLARTGVLSNYEQQALNAYQIPLTSMKPVNLPGTRNVFTAYPQSANYWTGSTTAAAKTQTSLVKGYDTENGWFMFDVSSIPTGSTINSVVLNAYLNDNNYPYWSVTPVTADPRTATSAVLFADIQAEKSVGYYLYINETGTIPLGWKNYTLPAIANTNLQAALTQGWFAMGVVDRDSGNGYWVTFDGWAEANRPYLTIDYTPPATGPSLNGGMVSPLSGNTSSTFTYSVQYLHTGNVAPTSAKVWIRPDALTPYTSYNLTYPTGSPVNYATWQTFTYMTPMAVGTGWQYYFEFNDGLTRTVVYNPLTAPATPYDGPDVYTPISGTLSINAAGGGTYTSFQECFTDLMLRGTDGSTVNVEVYGNYSASDPLLGPVPGTNAAGWINFYPATGENVTITSTGGTTSAPIRVNGASFIYFKGFSLTGGGNAGIIIESSSNIKVSHCKIYSNGWLGLNVKTNSSNVTAWNNFVWGNYTQQLALYDNGTGCNIKLFNNSVYADGAVGAAYHTGLTLSNSEVTAYNNTILRNWNGGSAFSVVHVQNQDWTTHPNTLLDYNSYYQQDGSTIFPTYATLAAWQASGNGQDVHSLEGNPYYVDPLTGDLHIELAVSTCYQTGTNLALNGVITDIDGDLRSLNPLFDIGADVIIPAATPAPLNQTATNVLNNRATLGWTEAGTATQWDIEWGAAGFTQGTGTLLTGLTANPHNLLSLSPSTAYGWYVRSNYGGGVYSAWTGPHTFTTLGAPLSVPWSEGFEAGFVKLVNNAGNGVNWALNTTLFSEGVQAAHNPYAVSNTNILKTSGFFDLTPFPEPLLTFNQIAKTEAGWDHCYVEISTDSGLTWAILPASAYQGTGAYALPSSNTPEGPCFTENAYTDWQSGTEVVPDNTWWKPETFNLSAYKTFTNVMLRFRLKADTSVQRYGWLIDNVAVNSRDFYDGKNILSFSLPEQTGPAVIDADAFTVEIEVAVGTDVSVLRPSFTLSPGAFATVSDILQVSGTTANDFSSPVTYMIEAENGDRQEWIVTVNVATAQSDQKAILAYSFPQQAAPAVIDAVNHTVSINVPFLTNVTNLVATFTISPFATAWIDDLTRVNRDGSRALVQQVSGVTANNFTNPVNYVVRAENLSTQVWVVTVTVNPPVPLVLPYLQNFDGTWAGTPAAPDGWRVYNADNDGYAWRRANNYITPTHSPLYAAVGMGCNNDWLVTPAIVQTSLVTKISWWDRVESASYPNIYDVMVSTTGVNIADFTINLGTYTCTNTAWTQHTINLTAFAGSTIFVAFHQTYSAATNYGFGIDDVEIQQLIANDLDATTITGPTASFANAPLNYTVTVVNNGTDTHSTYDVLLKSVSPAATLYTLNVTTPLIGGATTTHVLPWTPTTTGAYTLYGEVVPTLDTVPANNVTGNLPVTIYPAGILMESFETGTIPSNWTVLNVDGGDQWTASNAYPHTGTYSARVVYDVPNNDWLITPPLVLTTAGDDQISFWIGINNTSFSEDWEVLYSTTDTNPASFTLMDSGTLPAVIGYTQKVYDLDTFVPGDAIVYIALRCVSNDMLYLFADDFIGPMIYVPTSLPTPIVNTTVVGTSVVLSWDAIPYAYQYKIYQADDPYGTYELIVPSVPTNTYTIASPGSKKFYKVVASSDPIRAEQSEQPIARDDVLPQSKLDAMRRMKLQNN